MTDRDDDGRRPGALERHAQTLIGTVIAALVLWVGLTMQQQSVGIAELRVEVTNLRGQVSSLQSATADRYTAARAASDLAARDREINDLRDRVRTLERERSNP